MGGYIKEQAKDQKNDIDLDRCAHQVSPGVREALAGSLAVVNKRYNHAQGAVYSGAVE